MVFMRAEKVIVQKKKKKKVGQLCDAETTYSGNFLRDIVLKCNVNVPIVNIIVLADLK